MIPLSPDILHACFHQLSAQRFRTSRQKRKICTFCQQKVRINMAEKVGFEDRKRKFSELFNHKYVQIVHKISFSKTRTAMLFRLILWFLRRLQFGCSITDKRNKTLPLLIQLKNGSDNIGLLNLALGTSVRAYALRSFGVMPGSILG